MLSRREFVRSAGFGAVGVWPGLALPWGSAEVAGHCARRFRRLRAQFAESFARGEEVGACLAVMVDGEMVVDLWGGYRDAERTRPWSPDTLVCTMSVSKGIVATCAHMLVDRGLLGLEEPVAKHWPEFAAAGKSTITVRQLLSHMAALPVADAAAPGAAMHWEELTHALEVQAPIWPPGTKGTYHATTYGHLVGELVHRTSGKRIEDFVREELCRPLGVEFIFGCTDAEQARVAAPIANPANELTARARASDELSQRIYRLLGDRAVLRSAELCRSVFPSASGVSNARSLARIFGALARGGTLDEVTIMGPATLARATEEQWFYEDPIHRDLFRVTMGYLKSTSFTYLGPGAHTFGTAGSGGYTVFADPEKRMSFAYAPNRFTSGHGLGEQPRKLIDALYQLI